MTMPRVVPPRESEKGFQGWVTDLADATGWEWWHTWLSIHSPAGWPDLNLCRPPRLILAEVKGTGGKLSPAQKRTIALLKQVPGIEVYVWWPDDRPRIEELLRK